MRKNCSSDREKNLKFKAEGREFAKILRSLKQFLRTEKGQTIWKANYAVLNFSKNTNKRKSIILSISQWEDAQVSDSRIGNNIKWIRDFLIFSSTSTVIKFRSWTVISNNNLKITLFETTVVQVAERSPIIRNYYGSTTIKWRWKGGVSYEFDANNGGSGHNFLAYFQITFFTITRTFFSHSRSEQFW